jgi:hypothetical protein
VLLIAMSQYDDNWSICVLIQPFELSDGETDFSPEIVMAAG